MLESPVSSVSVPKARRDAVVSRRAVVGQGLATGLVASALGAGELYAHGRTAAEAATLDLRTKLRAISGRAKQLWPVIYVETTNLTATLERDVEAAFEGGADAVVLEIGRDVPALTRAVEHAKLRYPQAKIGVNYLGDDVDQYGFKTGFRLATDYDLDIVWTDFAGVDRIRELPEVSLHEIEAARPERAFYCSGIHMKYGTLLDETKTIEQSALQAMGWVDGVIVTGPRTGVPTDPERARRARSVLGSYPLGIASGVTAENFWTVGDYTDFYLVNTSISDPDHRILVDRVRRLRQVMGT